MKASYEIRDGSLAPAAGEIAAITAYTAPDDAEKQQLLDSLRLDRHDLDSALDPDEISRVEFDPEYVYMIWKEPNNVSFSQQLEFKVSSVGLFLRGGRLTVISGENDIPFTGREFQKVSTLNGVILRFFLQTVHHYFGHLKAIRQMNAEIQAKLATSMENRYLLQMFALGESLTYYLNAIEGNASVLAKLRAAPVKMGLTEDELDKLDDIIIEHQQCLRQTEIYSTVLSSLMDARASVINNNMNVLLKNLTLINIVFLPLNLIAGIGGMSEFSAFTQKISPLVSYSLFFLGMVAIGLLTWFAVRNTGKGKQKRALRRKRRQRG